MKIALWICAISLTIIALIMAYEFIFTWFLPINPCP
jgi:hypothetical protein